MQQVHDGEGDGGTTVWELRFQTGEFLGFFLVSCAGLLLEWSRGFSMRSVFVGSNCKDGTFGC